MRLTEKQKDMLDHMREHKTISARESVCPFHPKTIRSLLARGLIVYKPDNIYGYDKYTLPTTSI